MPGIDSYSLDNYGLDGIPGVQIAEGVIPTSDQSNYGFIPFQGGTAQTQAGVTVIKDFGFVPKIIFLILVNRNTTYQPLQSAYFEDSKYDDISTIATSDGRGWRLDGSNAYVRATGFRLPTGFSSSIGQLRYVAIGW